MPAVLCAVALLLCAIATKPVAEIGMNDDGPYIKSALVLAKTGHIAYFGWSAAILGWQLFLGALFAKLFGPTFTAVRLSTLAVALVTTFLIHRTFVRAGVNPRNATLATLCLALSPLIVPLALSFMTDIGGLFCIVLCLYACLRALQAKTDRAMFGWLGLCAFSNALGGTVRQVAWLGVLVIFPCSVWLLRKRSAVMPVAIALYLLSIAFILGSIHWFQQQPYSVPQGLMPEHFNLSDAVRVIWLAAVTVFGCGTFLLPILLAFIPSVPKRHRRIGLLILGALSFVILALALTQPQFHRFVILLAPYPGNYVSPNGILDGTSIKGMRPTILSSGVRLMLTLSVLIALVSFGTFLDTSRPQAELEQNKTLIPWKSLLVLTLPFSAAYEVLLMPPGLTIGFFDRYFLPLLFVGSLLLMRLFQERVQPNLPLASLVLIVVFAAYAVAGTHDAFALFRAKAEAFAALRAAGIPANSIDGGFEQNSMTQIERYGAMNDPRIRLPANVYRPPSSTFPENCQPQLAGLTPAIVPGYALSFDPSACGGPSHFAPVLYRNWLWGSTVKIYVVNTIRSGSPNR